jgi:ABC-type branched-subunit amino acid transport system substrate-binding protein
MVKNVLFKIFFVLNCFLLFSFLGYGEDENVVIGITVPLSGAYRDQGSEQLKGYLLSVQEINKQGGILGKTIVAEVVDTETKAQKAVELGTGLINDKAAIILTGCSSSAEAVALTDLAKEKKFIYMAGVTNSNATTGFDIDAKTGEKTRQVVNRYVFRWYNNAWMTARALAKYLLKIYNKGAKYYYITADYTWGHSIEKSLRESTEVGGAQTIGAVRVPIGTSIFSQYLLKAKEQNPDVLVLCLYGRDMIDCLRQAVSFGLKNKFKIVVPVIESNMAKEAGAEAMEGVVGSTPWYWTLKDKYSGSKDFYEKFIAEYNFVPCAQAASAWTILSQYADAVNRAGTFAPAQVIKALEGHKFIALKDEEYWRDWDHQGINSVLVVEGKKPAEQANASDVFNVLDEIPGESLAPSREENPVVWEEQL